MTMGRQRHLRFVILMLVVALLGSGLPAMAEAHFQGLVLGPAPITAQTIVVLRARGTGSHTSQIFTVSSDWQLLWNYRYPGHRRGSFRVVIFHFDGTKSLNEPVSQRGNHGHGKEYYHAGGRLYVVVHATCPWQVVVEESKKAPPSTPLGTEAASPTATSTSTPPPPPTSTPNPTPSPTVVPAPTVLLDLQASGEQDTPLFNVGPEWQIQWSYDCSNFGSTGNFIVNVFTQGGGFAPGGVNELGSSGSRIEYVHQSGTFYLSVNSECDWHIRVVTTSGGSGSIFPPTGSVLIDEQGSGQQDTQLFTTSGDEWQIQWSYTCARFGSRGNFIISVKTAGGGLGPGGVNELGLGGNRTEYEHLGGTYYLSINSECDWHVRVLG